MATIMGNDAVVDGVEVEVGMDGSEENRGRSLRLEVRVCDWKLGSTIGS